MAILFSSAVVHASAVALMKDKCRTPRQEDAPSARDRSCSSARSVLHEAAGRHAGDATCSSMRAECGHRGRPSGAIGEAGGLKDH